MTTGAGCLDCGTSVTDTILPHGRLCISCLAAATTIPQPCGSCDEIRPVGYRSPESDTDVCAGCAEPRRSSPAASAAARNTPIQLHRCAHCYLRELLNAGLTDPVAGTIHHQLPLVFDTLIDSRRPRAPCDGSPEQLLAHLVCFVYCRTKVIGIT